MSPSRSLRIRIAIAAAAWLSASTAIALEGPVNYELTRPAWAPVTLRLSTASAGSPGLSLDAGQAWFGRIGLGAGGDGQWRIGGGYRWRNGESLSLELTRSFGHAQPGLAFHYDWPRYYLRLTYDPQPGELTQQLLRFSAGIRF
jgi:hypothetical protein